MNYDEAEIVNAVIIPKRLVFENTETDYRMYGCDLHQSDEEIETHPIYGTFTLKGSMMELSIGERYEVEIQNQSTPQYPASYFLKKMKYELPSDKDLQREFLLALLTENQVNNIYDFYSNDEDLLKMIQKDEFDYESIKGLGESSYKKIRERVLAQAIMSELIAFLAPYGVTINMTKKIFKFYNEDPKLAIKRISENPYELVKVKGIGFKRADSVGLNLGIEKTSPHRINSSFTSIIEDGAFKKGDTWIPEDELVKNASALLGINKSHIKKQIEEKTYGEYGIFEIDHKFTMRYAYDDEASIAWKIENSITAPIRYFTDEEITEFLDNYEKETGFILEEMQRQFFFNWNNSTISFLIGSAGMGKSALMDILVKLLETKFLSRALMTPTGKSSKVLTNYVGEKASTIHRAIGLQDSTQNKPSKDIRESQVIVDEVSMADSRLIKLMFQAIDINQTKVLFVGDDYQLPSVGVGNFLYDCINSGKVTVTKLQKVFRQDEGGILDVATKVRRGEQFIGYDDIGRNVLGKDCVVDVVNQASMQDATVFYYESLLDKGYTPEDIMILSTKKMGSVGTFNMNRELQEIANPYSSSKNQIEVKNIDGEEFILREGDLIMNTVNTYDRKIYGTNFEPQMSPSYESLTGDLFNGDTGKILKIDEKKKVVYAEFDGIIFELKVNEMRKNILHSYCITIHKSQGDSAKVGILLIDKSSTFQLNANLIYTGVTRAKNYLLILGQTEAMINGGKKFLNMKRRSFLGEMLKEI